MTNNQFIAEVFDRNLSLKISAKQEEFLIAMKKETGLMKTSIVRMAIEALIKQYTAHVEATDSGNK